MKYEIKICHCGRIHFIPQRQITRALRDNKELLILCTNCGSNWIIGGDEIHDGYYGDGYMMYTNSFSHKKGQMIEIDRTTFKTNPKGKLLRKIILSDGYPVRMNTGHDANMFFGNRFSDEREPYFFDMHLRDMRPTSETLDSLVRHYQKHKLKKYAVDMAAMIAGSGMSDNQLMQISYLAIDSFNWEDLPYGYDINWCKPIKECSYNKGDFNFHTSSVYKFKKNQTMNKDKIQIFDGFGYIFLTEEEFKEKFITTNPKGVKINV